ncbi:MAG: bifunctional adenosylcobinamide kinase/adenosylcobinamide-phosphate guanylyltransferase, partial [Planctomycetes bacterium]|nr:bifunctional adenosylcobinamide kinase/adenosylcobinamide-phosphate guanylyltransferase [Planctomycetota bacterium]
MGRMILITGGCRSGKSAFAIQKAGELTERVCYIATCVPGDEEMKARVAEHRARRPDSWRTIEEPLHLTRVIGELDGGRWPVVVVDCLTLWLFNLMSEEDWGREA